LGYRVCLVSVGFGGEEQGRVKATAYGVDEEKMLKSEGRKTGNLDRKCCLL